MKRVRYIPNCELVPYNFITGKLTNAPPSSVFKTVFWVFENNPFAAARFFLSNLNHGCLTLQGVSHVIRHTLGTSNHTNNRFFDRFTVVNICTTATITIMFITAELAFTRTFVRFRVWLWFRPSIVLLLSATKVICYKLCLLFLFPDLLKRWYYHTFPTIWKFVASHTPFLSQPLSTLAGGEAPKWPLWPRFRPITDRVSKGLPRAVYTLPSDWLGFPFCVHFLNASRAFWLVWFEKWRTKEDSQERADSNSV
jgi:hypothetical protein